ncbi:bifunctional DNA primase/polymerase [Frankia sp. Cj5]|uniref:bifunctional DNA primase/polymerase n=1 Tax=Frankia sp. Cj5 TaxID=2880978 RepID=UPI001EF5C263|nr:bifunctional DNA primase/polymerase [Frankia sp. Cj5]
MTTACTDGTDLPSHPSHPQHRRSDGVSLGRRDVSIRPSTTPLPATDRPMRILVTGSRTWTNRRTIAGALHRAARDAAGRRVVLVCGACPTGADRIAEDIATAHGWGVEHHLAEWARHGRAAGPRRNTAMVDTRPDLCLAFIADGSRGATHTRDLAERAGIPTRTYTNQPEDPRLNAAFALIDAGRRVFVLGRTKRPVANCPDCQASKDDPAHNRETCPCLTCHGFYAATNQPDRAAAMLAAVPDGLLAIRTGIWSGLVVVDIDPAHGGTLDPALMTPTAAVATGGGGWHLHYAHPGRTILSRPLPGRAGVDIKADGGYVVAPPSVHPGTGTPYRWVGDRPVNEMPPALLTACRTSTAPAPALRRPAPVARLARFGGGGISDPAALLAATLDTVARAPEGRRRTTLYGAARGVARIVLAGHLTTDDAITALADVGRQAEQTDRDITAAITGGFAAEGLTP